MQVPAVGHPVDGSGIPGQIVPLQVIGQIPGQFPIIGMQVPAVGHPVHGSGVPGQVVSFTPQLIGHSL